LHQDGDRYNELQGELSHENHFKVKNISDDEDPLEDSTY
jgi:hypothetical protein